MAVFDRPSVGRGEEEGFYAQRLEVVVEVACRVGILEDEEDGVGASFGKGRKNKAGAEATSPLRLIWRVFPSFNNFAMAPSCGSEA